MAKKVLAISLVPVVVDVSVDPKEYRIDFSGPAAVESVRIPYGSNAPATVEFAVDGDYVATAGLYDVNDVLVGLTSSFSFSTVTIPVTKTVDGVGEITVSDA